jgi:ATP-dependent DNA helicase RecG
VTSIRSATISSSSPSGRRKTAVGLDDPIEGLPGAGPATAARLLGRGLGCVRDLLYFFPRSYDDYRRVYALPELSALPAGTSVVVRGTVVRVHKFFRRLLDVYLEDGGGRLRARWFRPNAGMVKTYARGTQVALAGSLHRTAEGEPELIHPSNVTALLAAAAGVGIRPRYPAVAKVPGPTVEKIVGAALAAAGQVAEILPELLRVRLGLPAVAPALSLVHRPPADLPDADIAALRAGASPAQRRFAFEELFVLQVALARERARVRQQPGLACAADASGILRAAAAVLPFSLTAAQQNAARRICEAMAGQGPMQCLLQGDVGSGKTAVAFCACLASARAGGQTLCMAPTAVLAEQHHRTLGAWAAQSGLSVGLLHAGVPAAEQRRVLAGAAAGQLDLIVGTHALLEDRLRLARLGLAIVDEQHRFGVRQRARLRRLGADENDWQTGLRGGMVPHLLVLSATPIPRSLALTLYGDLDLVTLDALPPGRKPVRTQVCRGPEARAAAYQALAQSLAGGAQAFVVCPAVAEDEARPLTSAVALGRCLRTKLAPARIGVLHGQLASARQQAIAEDFHDGRLDVLVATTVVEVGVDVPAARVMVIEDAERFGLAQLHQLRGRVGRGQEQAFCYLLTSSEDAEALGRLDMVAATADGFRIAEEDLRRRGSGDVHGTRQAGMPELRFADLGMGVALLEAAQQAAQAVLAIDPELSRPEHAALARAVGERLQQSPPIAEEAG